MSVSLVLREEDVMDLSQLFNVVCHTTFLNEFKAVSQKSLLFTPPIISVTLVSDETNFSVKNQFASRT